MTDDLPQAVEQWPLVTLGNYITRITRTNSNLKFGVEDVRGVTNQKEIASTKANIKERALEKFYILNPGEFIFNRRVHGTGARRLGLGFNTFSRSFIFTEDYVPFRVSSEELLPYFLFLFLLREDFNRYVVTNSWGSATEFFNWDDMCRVKIPLPPIEVQQQYVDAYQGLTAIIEQNEALLKSLEETAQACVAECRQKWPLVDLKPYIVETDNRNSYEKFTKDDVQGVSNLKSFIPTKADMNGVSLKPYKIVKHHEFSFVPVTSRNGEKLSIAMNLSNCSFIVSSAYTSFKVSDVKQLLPEYLQLQFQRPEFDRYARFNSWGSARETFNWDDMCRVKIPLPPIEVQQAIVSLYHCAEEARNIANEAKKQLALVCPAMIQRASHIR